MGIILLCYSQCFPIFRFLRKYSQHFQIKHEAHTLQGNPNVLRWTSLCHRYQLSFATIYEDEQHPSRKVRIPKMIQLHDRHSLTFIVLESRHKDLLGLFSSSACTFQSSIGYQHGECKSCSRFKSLLLQPLFLE